MVRTVSIKSEVERLIAQSESPVLLTQDFSALGSRRQIVRALGQVQREGTIARISSGVYARKKFNWVYGRSTLEYPLVTLAREYARRIGARVVPTDAEYANLTGRSTQVPVGNVVGVDRRIRRTLNYGEPRGNGVQFKWIPKGEERLAELGVEYLHTPVSAFKW